jgi:metal-responsive CopG/Arc/MetJ family transcriptional regulator
MRRNITLSLPQTLLSRAKLAAFREEKSLSEFMREALAERIDEGRGYEKAKRRQHDLLGKGLSLGTEGRFSTSRDELHERR